MFQMLERGLLCFCAPYANALLHTFTRTTFVLASWWPQREGTVACCPLNQFAMIVFFGGVLSLHIKTYKPAFYSSWCEMGTSTTVHNETCDISLGSLGALYLLWGQFCLWNLEIASYSWNTSYLLLTFSLIKRLYNDTEWLSDLSR